MSEYKSILAKIDTRGRRAPRVRLRQLADDAVATSKEMAHQQTGRYEIVGQIGRGGVGEVYRGRDVDLGRDVAMKVLRADHAGNAELIGRFVEEAQVGGQLQHPGIVPVYELGLQEDRRPYFAMKLVKGRTLAALLGERKGPADRRRHFLSIFAQVCQTIAYAHSRGVIHRDLKPLNVMVGSFGEVQVVDWGFAKVLAQEAGAEESPVASDPAQVSTVRTSGESSGSVAGSVMGTPAYMPPEQALGQVGGIDERSDVFALGSMLTEILTGGPAYVGEPGELLVRAARCDTGDALARLDACGGDPKLVALARSCLSAAREDRPGDAGALAAAVTHHLAAAEERARRSKLLGIEARRKAAEAQAEAAQAKAKSEAARAEAEKEKAKAERARREAERAAAEADRARRTRRQMLMLAAASLAVVLAGGGAFWFVGKGRRERARETEAQVALALESARHFKGSHEWDEAVLAARQAVDLGGGTEARSTLEAIEKAKAEADAKASQRKRELTFVARLEGIRLPRADRPERMHESFLRAFREFGIDVEKRTVPQASAMIRSIPEWQDVARALDEWAWLGCGPLAAKLTEIAKAADPDPLRSKLLDARAEGDVDELEALAAGQEVSDRLSRRTISLVALALVSSGDRTGAIRFLRGAWELHPDDLSINLQLARLLAEAGQHAEAARFYVAALALRSRSVPIRNRLSESLCRAGEPAAAVAVSRDAVALAPDDAIARAHLAAGLVWEGDRDGGLRAYGEAVALAEDKAAVHLEFGRALDGLGDDDLGLEALRKAVETSAEPDYLVHASLGAALRAAGDAKGAVEQLRRSVELNPREARGLRGLGRALVDLGRQAEAAKVMRTCVELRPYDWQAHDDLAKSLNALRRYEDARAEAEKATELAPSRNEPQLRLGGSWLGEGKLRRAQKAFYKALPLGSNAYLGLGYALAAEGNLGQAEIATREAAWLDPANAVAIGNSGRLLARRGDFDGASKKLRAAAALGGDELAPIDLALVVAKADPEASLGMLERVRAENPGIALLAMRAAGRVRMSIDDLDGAIGILQKALEGETATAGFSFEIANHRALTWYELGLAHLRKGDFEKALDAFRKSHDLGKAGPHWTKPTSTRIDECQELLKAKDPIALAKRRYYERKWAESVSLFAKAMEGGSGGGRLVAARAAARAGERERALAWLREGVKELEEQLGYRNLEARREARDALLDLFDLPDFRPYRVERRLKEIPEPERGEWRAFWVELRLELSKQRPVG